MTSDGKSDLCSSQPIIPRGEHPCVWMTAGVLNFRLCDRNLDCGSCPLEHALRNSTAAEAAEPRPAPRQTTPGGCLVPEDLFFHAGHTWVRLLTTGEFEVGLDDFGCRVTGPATAVSLPTSGDHLQADESSVGIEGRDLLLKLRAPFTGTVSRSNDALAGDPDLLRRDPYGAGYLYRARPGDPTRAIADLHSGSTALCRTADQEQFLCALIDVAVARTGDAVTLNDGGLLSDDLLAGVPPVKARRIRDWIFNAPWSGRKAGER